MLTKYGYVQLEFSTWDSASGMRNVVDWPKGTESAYLGFSETNTVQITGFNGDVISGELAAPSIRQTLSIALSGE